jgi:hypothetical protein
MRSVVVPAIRYRRSGRTANTFLRFVHSVTFALFKSLQQKAVATYRVVSHEEMTPVQHRVTNELVSPSPGRYLLINGRYHGLDHSGDEADGEADELWAALFEEYQSCRGLEPDIRALIEELIVEIKALPKPLDPCDKD